MIHYEDMTKEQVIRILKDTLEYAEEKDREIERLTELCNKYEKEHKTTFEEWKKDINIINELEKDMIFDMNDYGKDLDIQTGNIYLEYHRGYCQNGKDYYDKLQELKGSNNNE